jgi:group I intron endonuclease
VISGIYQIRNLINGKIYIGSAINLKVRKYNHFYDLKNNKHHNIKLQRSYNKYGLDNFSFEILEYIENKSKLIEREQFYFDTIKPHFNISPTAGSTLGVKCSDELKMKLSLSQKGNKTLSEEHKKRISLLNTGRIVSEETKDKFRRLITQYDLDGNFIKEWPSIKSAIEELKITSIGRACQGKFKHAGGFKWKYRD